MNKSLLKHRWGDTIDQGEYYIASYIMFAKSLQWRDGDDLAVDVDDEHAGGGVEPSEGDSGGVSPLRRVHHQHLQQDHLHLSTVNSWQT